MRELKFRAWYSPGMARQEGFMDYGDNQANSGMALHIWQNDLLCLGPVSVHIMQFTGLTDKNGKEVYEGDIIDSREYPFMHEGWRNYRGEIIWVNEDFCYGYDIHVVSNRVRGGTCGGMLSELPQDFEVIGNIHEHPELLDRDTVEI